MSTSLQSRVKRAKSYMAKVEGAVTGHEGSRHTFSICCTLLREEENEEDRAGFGLPPKEALNLLLEWNRKCRPPWSEAELVHKLNGAAEKVGSDCAGLHSGTPHHKPVQATFEPQFLEKVASRFPAGVDIYKFLAERSALPPDRVDSNAFLHRLFRAEETVIIFTTFESQGQLIWTHGGKTELPKGGDEGVWFLCQPVDGLWHPNPRLDYLKLSRRSEESVTSWRYFVIESDKADKQLWLRALVQMPLRIAAIYGSGGRSIHALCRVDAATKQQWDDQIEQLKPPLIRLGADRGSLTAVRLTRLPGCLRGDREQKLLFLNPEPQNFPIAS